LRAGGEEEENMAKGGVDDLDWTGLDSGGEEGKKRRQIVEKMRTRHEENRWTMICIVFYSVAAGP
jgi:hypothetical protein